MSNPNNAATSIASVSETNRSRIMNHLYRNGVSSRAQIAKALGLTPAAITKITARLIDAGVVKETGDMEGIKNRRSIGLALDSDAFHVIGVKFARSLVQIGVFDLSGKPLAFREMPKVTEDTIDATIAGNPSNHAAICPVDPRRVTMTPRPSQPFEPLRRSQPAPADLQPAHMPKQAVSQQYRHNQHWHTAPRRKTRPLPRKTGEMIRPPRRPAYRCTRKRPARGSGECIVGTPGGALGI